MRPACARGGGGRPVAAPEAESLQGARPTAAGENGQQGALLPRFALRTPQPHATNPSGKRQRLENFGTLQGDAEGNGTLLQDGMQLLPRQGQGVDRER